jgi:hypothetical protein
MLQSLRLGFLAILSLLLIIAYLPKASTSPLQSSQRDNGSDHESHTRFAPGKLGAVACESDMERIFGRWVAMPLML